MDEIPGLGTAEDRQLRLEKQRTDSVERQTLIRDARKKLYDEGYAVDGEHVDGLLKGESLVPTEVRMRLALPPDSLLTLSTPRTHFRQPCTN